MSLINEFRFFLPTEIVFGWGVLNTLNTRTLPGERALILTTSGKSARANGYLNRVEQKLREAGISSVVFEEIEANPLRKTVMKGARFARENGCDFVIALGGGSCIDSAKGIAAMATNPGDLWDYMKAGTGGGKELQENPLPIISIPTTAGTGSEVDPWGAIIEESTNEKISFGEELTRPALAVIDPELTASVPPRFTAYQGFDALFHATERYLSKFTNPISDLFALQAVGCIAGNLENAVKHGKTDRKAKEQVALGNLLAGMAMNLCPGLSHHPLENAMTAFHPKLPHGEGLLMICEAYFSHLARIHACDERMVRLAKAMGMAEAGEAMDYVRMLKKLKEACGLNDLSMKNYGITPEEFPLFVENARETYGAPFQSDRVPLCDADCIEIYREAFNR